MSELGPQGRGELLLLAEDEDLVRRAAQRVLERNGYRVLAAEDGRAAVALFEAHVDEVALVVTDVMMPHLGAQGVVTAVRSRRPALPIICTSGYAEQTAGETRALPDGTAFIHKPWKAADMLHLLRRLLDGPAH